MSSVKRLVCVVEGRGEMGSIPLLCTKVRDYLEAWSWLVDHDPVRLPRSQLVNERQPSPRRTARIDGLTRAVGLALSRPADAVLVVCDADNDCAASWGVSARQLIEARVIGDGVMVVREYEAWLLASTLACATVGQRSIETIRDAKGAFAKVWPGYKPSVHQLPATKQIDVASLRSVAPSFDKLVRTLGRIFATQPEAPPRRPR